MENEERFKVLEDENKRLNNRLNLQEDEIERLQKDIQILGENCKIETQCFQLFENSFTKKLIKDQIKNEIPNTPQTPTA
jgi:predicted nuclease with TOPRIM domain